MSLRPEKLTAEKLQELKSWCSVDNWNRKFLGKYKISMVNTSAELRAAAVEYEPLRILIEQSNLLADPAAFRQALETAVWKKLGRGEDTELALRILFYQGKANQAAEDDYGSLSVALEAEKLIDAGKPTVNIIQQSVDVYRKALVLPGEDPAKVVAELHCRADFEDMDTRYLTALWRAPIVVTTAVAFFETMASNRPSALRRLHELPGSVVFVDEAHNALPIDLLPLAWGWMNALAEEWGCYWVLASGSLVRYWALPRLMALRIPQPNVCELVPEHLRAELMQYETGRIRFQWEPEPLSRQALCQRVQASPGPRLLILNTVQSAAVFASDLCDAYGREAVEHLSTALTAADRAAASERIKKRLQDQTDTDWTLVATSCVEAGVDFSFRTGFREVSSLLSLLQAAGRVNRHGTESEAEMWSFRLKDDSMLRPNKALHIEQEVLQRYFMKRMEITPELSTGFLNDVLAQDGSCLQKISSLLQEEENLEFADIEEKFKVIEENTVLAVVDEALAKRILFGKADWTELQKNSVSVRKSNIRAWNLKEIGDGLYQWTLRYDPFLGYMRGVLDMERAKHGFLNC